MELLVAIALFGLVLSALAGVFVSSARSIGDQRLRTAATRVASHHLETLRTVAFDDLDSLAGLTTTTTPDGRAFMIDTRITAIDASTGAPAAGGRVKAITATVTWTVPGGARREVSHTTAVAGAPGAPAVPQTIGTVTMFPSPSTADAVGRPLADIEVTVPLSGFTVGALVHLAWTNADGTAEAKTLTSTTGLNWRGTVAKEQVLAALSGATGEVQFTVSVGSLSAVYGLIMQRAAASPPTLTGATIDRNPVTVAKPAGGRTCAANNQCQNRTDVVFTATTTGLDPAQDSVILQYQLYDGSFQEVPLAPVSGVAGQWRLTVRQRTTRFGPGTARAFRFTAIRSADGATAGSTVLRDVVST